MWEGKVTVEILTEMTQCVEVTTGWYNELWGIKTGTEQAGKTVEQKIS